MSDERVGADRTLLDSPQRKEGSCMAPSSHSRTPLAPDSQTARYLPWLWLSRTSFAGPDSSIEQAAPLMDRRTFLSSRSPL
jgi:hypothetical protein